MVLERLRDVVERAFPHRSDGGLDRRVGRDHHDHDLRVAGLEVPQHLEPGLVGEHQIQEHEVNVSVLGLAETVFGIHRLQHLEPLPAKQSGQNVLQHRLVVDDQYSHSFSR